MAVCGPSGNRWFKVNLHVHGEGSDAKEIVESARRAEIDLIAVTDHQSFSYYDAICAAAATPGRSLIVLPGIEITAHEGCHLLAIFPTSFSVEMRSRFFGWLEIDGSGDTRAASKRAVLDILKKVHDLSGIIVAPHPFSEGIGLLDDARKISTKVEWLESGHIKLMQIREDLVRYVDRDEGGNWINRYVLASARPRDVRTSSYSLAPFNRSDTHKGQSIDDGCSWFRMSEGTVEALQQVACEPRSRISRTLPALPTHSAILGMRISGGYCDGQCFGFNDGLTCVIGQNYAGKSAVFDFIRFGTGHRNAPESEERLLQRLHGILGPGGSVELYVRHNCEYYVLRRSFNPQTSGEPSYIRVACCTDPVMTYRADLESGQLVPIDNFEFPLEVYEQGRISRLRDDVSRQLDMLDEFASLSEEKVARQRVVNALDQSASRLWPLYEEKDRLQVELATLPEMQRELTEKEKLLPGEEEQRWGRSVGVVCELEAAVREVNEAAHLLHAPSMGGSQSRLDIAGKLFTQTVPEIKVEEVAHAEILTSWIAAMEITLSAIAAAKQQITLAVREFTTASEQWRTKFKEVHELHERQVREELAKAGVESPAEVLKRVQYLRQEIRKLVMVKQPRLAELKLLIDREEQFRKSQVEQLFNLDHQITQKRQEKAKELTESLDGQIQIEPHGNTQQYAAILNELVNQVTGRGRRIQNRETQLQQVVTRLSPIVLANALVNDGVIPHTGTSLADHCQITDNTAEVLCSIAADVRLMNKLQTVCVPAVPRILVRRRGEQAFGDLRTGLSPGEQSAAILTLALQTRSMPLVLDQPEDELGYSYVVHLIVPKILDAKRSRQLLMITHNANIPVLGDADFVMQMENRPMERGRLCVIANAGCFESGAVTNALVDLEGGKAAFHFRRHRYGLPHTERPGGWRVPFLGDVD